jgi:hypothetical protein
MTDWILAILALGTFAVFVATVPLFVPDIDLIVVTAFAVGLAAYDFWRELTKPKNGD